MEKVWVCDPHEGFVLGRIVDLTEEGALVARLVCAIAPSLGPTGARGVISC